jgi:hypothetical protein
MEFVLVSVDYFLMDLVFQFAHQVSPESQTNAEDANLHVSSAQALRHSALTVWTLLFSFETQEDATKAQAATTVKSKTKKEDVRESAAKTYSS